jgi:GntR family histidine utilization transcriptional repressor
MKIKRSRLGAGMGAMTAARHREFDLPRDAERSLGQRIRQFVEAKIESGEWPEGHRVPSETELAERLGAARMTVHGALRALAAEGLVVRRPGAGTHVAAKKPRATMMEVRNIVDEIAERGHRHEARVELLRSEACDLAIATELGIPTGSVVHHSVIVHFENGRPLQIEDRHVLPAFARDYLKLDFTRTTPYAYLMSQGPLDEVEHVIQALTPDEPTRALLTMAPGEPVLHVHRRTWSGGRVVSSARLIHPGSRYSLFGRFRPARRRWGEGARGDSDAP